MRVVGVDLGGVRGARASNVIKIHFTLHETSKELMKTVYALKRILVFTITNLIATPSIPYENKHMHDGQLKCIPSL